MRVAQSQRLVRIAHPTDSLEGSLSRSLFIRLIAVRTLQTRYPVA